MAKYDLKDQEEYLLANNLLDAKYYEVDWAVIFPNPHLVSSTEDVVNSK